jgi:hypothetical protein
MIRRPPRSTQSRSSAASDVYKRQLNKAPQFSFFDKTSGRPKSKWEQDIKMFANTLVDEMINDLSFNPLDGPREISRIGFL